MSEQARQQAQAEKLTLLVAESKTGYFGVSLDHPGQAKPYQARVWRGGETVQLGHFATAEEAALCVARSQEGQTTRGGKGGATAQSQGMSPAIPPCAILTEADEGGSEDSRPKRHRVFEEASKK